MRLFPLLFLFFLIACGNQTDKSPEVETENTINSQVSEPAIAKATPSKRTLADIAPSEPLAKSTIRYISAPSGLNLRTSESSNSKILTTIPFGDIIYLQDAPKGENLSVDGIDGHMTKVKYLTHTGYMFDGYLSESVPKLEDFKGYINKNYYPNYVNNRNVLEESQYHEEEVWEGADKQKWLALFLGADGFELKEEEVFISRVYDAVLDNEGEATGWEVKIDRSKPKPLSYVLLSDKRFSEGAVDYAWIDLASLKFAETRTPESYVGTPSPFSLQPDEEVSFTFKNIQYELSATGETVKEEHYEYLRAYKLHLKASSNGQDKKQTLVSIDRFDDNMLQILWVGDLDRDGKLDIIANISNHYNMSRTAVFLSSEAKENQLVRYFGECQMVGC